jgi:hypothetical protein
MTLEVIDLNPSANIDYIDVTKVEKQDMPDDVYDTRRDTVREFKRNMKLGILV